MAGRWDAKRGSYFCASPMFGDPDSSPLFLPRRKPFPLHRKPETGIKGEQHELGELLLEAPRSG